VSGVKRKIMKLFCVVLCRTVVHNDTHAHICEQFLQFDCSFSFRFLFCAIAVLLRLDLVFVYFYVSSAHFCVH